MKKIIKSILAIFIFTSILLYVPFNHAEDEHDHGVFNVVHVYAWGPGDIYGSCPNCPAGALEVMDAFNPDCTNAGHLFVLCSNCGYGDTINLPALGHDYNSSMTSQPTCTSNGTRVYTCTRCSSSYSESVSALGHSYNTVISKQATCLQTGEQISTCTRCGNSTSSVIPALGHDYKTVTTKAATCTEAGIQTSTCSRCNDKYTRTLKALGHDYVEELVEATCTEDGHKTLTCSRCGDSSTEILKALGHDLSEEKIIKEPSCTEDGLKTGICQRCDETIETIIPKLGHKYPDEWTVEKENSYFSDGLEIKICTTCADRIEQIIPRKNPAPLIASGAGLVAIGTAVFFFLKKRPSIRKIKKVSDGIEDIDKFKPSFEDKTLVVCSENEDLINMLKEKHYLQVNSCIYDEVVESVTDNEPDLCICDIGNKKQLNEIIELKKEDWKDLNLGLIVNKKTADKNRKILDDLVKDKQIVNYLTSEDDLYKVMIKLVLPVMKPKYNSDETLGNIGGIADLLGIPGVSSLIDLYLNGRDIKATIEEGELSASSVATVISDIAYILGFDTVGDVVNLVNDVEDIKSSLDKEAGVHEGKGGIKAGKDIVDVVSDLIDK